MQTRKSAKEYCQQALETLSQQGSQLSKDLQNQFCLNPGSNFIYKSQANARSDYSTFIQENVSPSHAVIIKYSFTIPPQQDIESIVNLSRFKIANNVSEIGSDRSLVIKCFRELEHLFRIHFIENNDSPNIRFFKFDEIYTPNQGCHNNHTQQFLKGFWWNPLPSMSDPYDGAIGFNTAFFDSCEMLGIVPRKYKTVMHEIAHAVLSFEHLFNYIDNNQFKGTVRYTSLSVSNYLHEADAASGLPLYPITLMPYDRLSANRWFSPNLTATIGDTTYFLNEYIDGNPAAGYKTIAAFDDIDGIDTVNARLINASRITIDLRSNARSDLGIGYVYLPDGIENIVSGNHSNVIILNSLNNIVDLSSAERPSVVMLDPQNCGHDTIIGFNVYDKIILERAPAQPSQRWQIITAKNCDISLPQRKFSCQRVTRVIFDNHNSIDLANLSPEEFKAINLESREHELAVRCRLFYDREVLANQTLPKNNLPLFYANCFIADFSASATRGTLFSFATTLTQTSLKNMAFTERQISAASIAAMCLLALTTGSTLSCSAAVATNIVCNYLGFNNASSILLSTIAAELISDFSLLNAASLPAKITGSYVGVKLGENLFRFGMWVKRKATDYISPPQNDWSGGLDV